MNAMWIGLRSLALRLAAFVAGWWILAGGSFEDPVLAGAVILAALLTSFWMIPAGRWRLRLYGIICFAPYFVWNSLLGGLDVAARAFSPRMPLRPEFVIHRLRCSETQALLMTWIVSLLPGTASVRLYDGKLRVHVLDGRLPVAEKLRELEEQVRRVCD